MSTLLNSSPAGAVRIPAADRLLARVRSAWRRATLARGVMVSTALLTSLVVLLLLVDLVQPLPVALREVLRFLPLAVAVGWLLRTIYRTVRPPPAGRLALLAEERLSLDNRLVTALELPAEGRLAAAFRTDAEPWLAGVDPRRVAPFRPGATLAVLGAGIAVLVALSALAPRVAAEAWARWIHPEESYQAAWSEARADVLPGEAAPPATTFAELRWRIQPPAYTGLAAQEQQGAGLVSALPGSRIGVRSHFPRSWSEVRAEVVGGRELPVRRDGDEWTTEWTFRSGDRGLSLLALAGGEVVARRVVALAVAADQPPEVELARPDSDMVVATAAGRIPILATASDDYGIGTLDLTWIRSRGSGESFTFEEGEWEWSRLMREGSEVRGEFTLDLAAMDLRPGDVLHIRAVARDRNMVTGPGEGVSATRVVRIALPEEMHTATTLIGYPLQGELNPLLSQRMLILMTEDLRDREPRLEREEVLEEANEIAFQQERLRIRVGELVYTRSVGGLQSPTTDTGFEDTGGVGAHEHETVQGAGAPPSDPAEVLADASAATGTGSPEELSHRHDEAPIIDVNRDRITIYNLMWEAERALRQGEPSQALPQQYEALRLLQAQRAAERVYVRGQTSVPTVDVRDVRGSGEIDEADPAARSGAAAVAAAPEWLPELERLAEAAGEGAARELATGLSALAARMLADPRVEPRAAAMVSRAAEAAGQGDVQRTRGFLAGARSLLSPGTDGGSAVPLDMPTHPVAADYFRRLGEGR